MASIQLNAELRTDLGKGASRRLRHAEKMPAILYGGDKEPVGLTLLQKDIRALQDTETFYTSIIDLNVDGKGEKVVVRDVQHHPYKADMMHIDFQRIDDKHKLHMHVPLHFVGEEKSPGVKLQGGAVSHLVIEVEVECLPKDIPEFIEVDMSGMNSGDIIHLSDLKLPAGVELMQLKQGEDHDTAVCSIHPPKGGAAAAEEEGGEEEAGEE
jgi:large subunit ribosomal protein L25